MIVGIDLGTTNSLVAVWQNGEPRLIPNSLGDFLTPSCVSVDEDGTILTGKAARERLQTHPAQSAAVFKRHMGSNMQFNLGGRNFRAEELSALILRALKEDAEAALGQPVTEAIITVPAYFSDAQRKATRAAGQLAGLKVERLLNEPTAAALAYGIHQRDQETQFLVFDLGGGTFDVSVLDLFEGVMEVRASAGDNFLGGEDFVNLLTDEFFKQAAIPVALKNDGRFMQSLLAQVEQAKRQLSEASQATLQTHHAGTSYSMPLDEAALERICAPLLARLRSPVERALRDANLHTANLDSIVLAGGATRMPIVRRMVARMFGRFPSCDINPDEVVALGAAVQAGLKMNDAALDEIVMTDVAPYSLGVEVSMHLGRDQFSYGHFDPIIERNTVVPVSKVKSYYPNSDKQTSLRINVFQGEARMVRDNISLGSIDIPIAQVAGQDNGVDVRFTYDANGLLQVEATVTLTKQTHALVIEGNPGVLSPDEIKERFAALSELKIHPRDRIEFRTMLARGERLYQQLRGAAREELGRQLMQFERALEAQDDRTSRQAAKTFQEMLEYFEHQSFLNLDE
ncbi:Hsp70 family protein [Pseudoduganella sp. DS3]|uniref:Hsp70 family protein n=1 Tax=Pseudoduganella guangdongensis TaxID=2692179 RepID=A0A6N9HK53_9BURK|nr:molecular chaperone HscC [Pseudoduganella guangdongensis]MYN03716.1 Hsp70 family protein [Pseudoduganella guangdongensis]